MNSLARWMPVTLLMVIYIGSAHADLNSTQRVRAFAKLPDWSGIWEQFNIGASGGPEDPKELRNFIALAIAGHPPYNAEWERKFQAANHSSIPQDQPVCTFGFPNLMIWSPLMFQAIVTPEETTIIFNSRETRHVHTDGRAHPRKDDLFPTAWGDSIAHWEAQTLVVDTIATSSPLLVETLDGGVWTALSSEAHFIERIRMVDHDTLEDQMLVKDSIALEHDWSLTRQYKRAKAMDRLVDEECTGNERNPVLNGKFTLAPP
jgi:hypothetical protein